MLMVLISDSRHKELIKGSKRLFLSYYLFIIKIFILKGLYDKMLENELDKFFSSKSGRWDKQIAFSPKDISEMLHLPLSSITKYMREDKIKVFKIGRHYRVTRLELYRFIENNECINVI